MNIYVPEAYFQSGSVGAYTAQTAPDLPAQSRWGLHARPARHRASGSKMPGPTGPARTTPLPWRLARGYVVASPGARGRTTPKRGTGIYTGKAPAAIVDLKAAVRYLRFNDAAHARRCREASFPTAPVPAGPSRRYWAPAATSPDYEAALAGIGCRPRHAMTSSQSRPTARSPTSKMPTPPTSGSSTAFNDYKQDRHQRCSTTKFSARRWPAR